jgi:general nucleoside transport system permease protein
MNRMLDLAIGLRIPIAIAAALLTGSLLIAAGGGDPVKAYGLLFKEAFLDYWGLSNTLVKTSPILLAALAVIVPLRAGLYNIGGEGQIYIGGLFATIAALHLDGVTVIVALPTVILAAMTGGALWAALAGALRAWRSINEVIVTLLLNFIAIHIVSYAVSGPMMAAGAPYPYSDEIPQSLRLPILMPQTDAHMGVIFGLTAAAAITFIFMRTSIGMALDVAGRSANAAQYAGLNVKRQIVLSMATGGALAGLAGGIEVLGLKYRLFHLFSAGYGFDGIVAAFMTNAHPALAPVSSFFLAGLQSGANVMQRAAGIDGTVVEAIVGIIIIFVAASLAWRTDLLRAFLRKGDRDEIPSIQVSRVESK